MCVNYSTLQYTTIHYNPNASILDLSIIVFGQTQNLRSFPATGSLGDLWLRIGWKADRIGPHLWWTLIIRNHGIAWSEQTSHAFAPSKPIAVLEPLAQSFWSLQPNSSRRWQIQGPFLMPYGPQEPCSFWCRWIEFPSLQVGASMTSKHRKKVMIREQELNINTGSYTGKHLQDFWIASVASFFVHSIWSAEIWAHAGSYLDAAGYFGSCANQFGLLKPYHGPETRFQQTDPNKIGKTRF